MLSVVQTGASAHAWMCPNMLATPCSNETLGVHPNSPLIFRVSAQVQSGSPGRFGTYTTDPPSNSTSRLTLCGELDPRLKIYPDSFDSAAAKNARATSVA